jgi:hypothetical protein
MISCEAVQAGRARDQGLEARRVATLAGRTHRIVCKLITALAGSDPPTTPDAQSSQNSSSDRRPLQELDQAVAGSRTFVDHFGQTAQLSAE